MAKKYTKDDYFAVASVLDSLEKSSWLDDVEGGCRLYGIDERLFWRILDETEAEDLAGLYPRPLFLYLQLFLEKAVF